MDYEAELLIAKLKGKDYLAAQIQHLINIQRGLSSPPYRSVVIATLERDIIREIAI